MNEDCVFCKIIEGEIPSHKIYEDENMIAILDANPVSKGHTLVIPKKHVENIHGAEGMNFLHEGLVKVSNAIQESLSPDGINIAQNNGEKAGQEVFHLHFHVTPIYDGGELDVTYNRKDLEKPEKTVEEVSKEL